MTPPAEAAEPGAAAGPAGPAEAAAPPSVQLRRFEPAVRRVHRATAVLMGVCVSTAAALYLPQLSTLVGHRYLVEQVHVYSGFALPVPALLGVLSGAYRADARRLNRWTPADTAWLRSRTRRDGTIRVGKFNAGQKLNGALSAGAVLVLLGTGVLMFFTGLVRLTLRAGATFVHDWTALALGLLVLGHLVQASADPLARRGMRMGDVGERWARKHHAAWADEELGPDPDMLRDPDVRQTRAAAAEQRRGPAD